MDSTAKEIMTLADFMKYISVGRSTAYKILKSGEIRCCRVGKLYRIPKQAVDEYLASQNV